jgi:hypothetical protein
MSRAQKEERSRTGWAKNAKNREQTSWEKHPPVRLREDIGRNQMRRNLANSAKNISVNMMEIGRRGRDNSRVAKTEKGNDVSVLELNVKRR